MTLEEYLSFIRDEDVRIELEIDEGEKDYLYTSFWLSDFRNVYGGRLSYAKWEVESVSFMPEMDNSAELLIQIKS